MADVWVGSETGLLKGMHALKCYSFFSLKILITDWYYQKMYVI